MYVNLLGFRELYFDYSHDNISIGVNFLRDSEYEQTLYLGKLRVQISVPLRKRKRKRSNGEEYQVNPDSGQGSADHRRIQEDR